MKTILFILLFVPGLMLAQGTIFNVPLQPTSSATFQRTPLSFTDSMGTKLYLLKNGRVHINIAGSKGQPSMNFISLDSGFSAHREIALILASQGGTQLINQIGLKGEGGVYIEGQRSKDTTSGVQPFAKFYFDSTMINVAGSEFMKIWGSVVQAEKNLLLYNSSTFPAGFAPNIIFKTVTVGDSGIFLYTSSPNGIGRFFFDHMVQLPEIDGGVMPYYGSLFWAGDSLVLGTSQSDTRIVMKLNGASVGQVLAWNGSAWIGTTIAGGGGAGGLTGFRDKLSDGSVDHYRDSTISLAKGHFTLSNATPFQASIDLDANGNYVGTDYTSTTSHVDSITSRFNATDVTVNKNLTVTGSQITIATPNGAKRYTISTLNTGLTIGQTFPNRSGTYMVTPDALAAGGLAYTDATDWKVLSPTNGSFLRGGAGSILYHDLFGTTSIWTQDVRIGGVNIYPRLVMFQSAASDSNGLKMRASGGMTFIRGWIGLPDVGSQATQAGDLSNTANKLYFNEGSKKRVLTTGDKYEFYFRGGFDTVLVSVPGMTATGNGIPMWVTNKQVFGTLKVAYTLTNFVVLQSSATESSDSLHGIFTVIDY